MPRRRLCACATGFWTVTQAAALPARCYRGPLRGRYRPCVHARTNPFQRAPCTYLIYTRRGNYRRGAKLITERRISVSRYVTFTKFVKIRAFEDENKIVRALEKLCLWRAIREPKSAESRVRAFPATDSITIRCCN